ncbi:MAG: AraC family transcriptional regulator [Bacteroidia bacterium]
MLNTLIWAALIQGLLLGLLYLFSKKYESRANRLLGGFLISLIIEGTSIFIPYDYIGSYSINYYFTTPEVKLFFPLFFVHFVLEKVGQSARYQRFLKIHYGIGVGVMGITLINIFVFLFNGLQLHEYVPVELVEALFMGQQWYAFLMSIVAFTIAIIETRAYRKKVENEFSDYTMLEIQWLWQFIFIIFPVILLWGAELVRIFMGGTGGSDIVLASWGMLTLFIYFVSYKAFRHQNLFENKVIESQSIAEDISAEPTQTDHPDLSEKINSLMEEGKYYLNQELTIYDLAREMNLSPRLISSCVNGNLGVNFSEWVNNYRVDEALKILEDADKNYLSIEGVGAEAGFKSRSAMYTAFKKKTGFPPGHFRENV